MFFLPASLLALLAVTVFAGPIDLPSRRQQQQSSSQPQNNCDSGTVTQIFDTLSYDPATATAFCTHVLAANIDLKALSGRLQNRSPADITAACQCIVSTSTTFAAPAPPASTAASSLAASIQQPAKSVEVEELRLREARPQAQAVSNWDPYGKGAEPVPLGSEFKGFGGKVPYMRGNIVEGTRW